MCTLALLSMLLLSRLQDFVASSIYVEVAEHAALTPALSSTISLYEVRTFLASTDTETLLQISLLLDQIHLLPLPSDLDRSRDRSRYSRD